MAANLNLNSIAHGLNKKDLPEEILNALDCRHDSSKDWSQYFTVHNMNVLKETTKKICLEQDAKINRGQHDQMELFEYETFNPDTDMSKAQQFIVNHHLYHLQQWDQYNKGELDSAPQSQAILVEGLPSVSKLFIIKIIRNITRLYHNRNDADLVSAPTGAAASIIGGKTHHRNLSIPAGGK